MNGIIAIDKPQGYTSFDIIAILRKKLGQRKIGHMGTLDPMATGVLPVLLGQTAKFQVFTEENEKEYVAEIKLGVVTDTWDIFGKVLSENLSNIKESALELVLHKFKGEINQVPPMYSAIKIGGVKLCDLARKGKEIERKSRFVNIKSINLIEFDKQTQTAKIKVRCSKGTYIRSLCFDIGAALGCGACMGNLRRTLSNSFTLSNCVSLENLKNLGFKEIVSNYVLPTDYLFRNKESIYIDDEKAKLFQNGVDLKLPHLNINLKDKETVKLYKPSGFLGLGKVDLQNQVIKFLKCECKE